jgi:Fe-S cluster assembly iron-binding protein IscA
MLNFNLSTTARDKFKEFLSEENKDSAYIRIYVSGVG